MKAFYKSLKRQDGFTLVELMVVVAIIGLLSGVAIPNFKKYQSKAKVSEAKLQLSAVYIAQQSFYSDFNMYGHCLTYMGFDPNLEKANRYYSIGIQTPIEVDANAYAAAINSGLNATDCPNVTTAAVAPASGVSSSLTNQFPAGKGVGGAIADESFIPTSTIGDQSDQANMTFTIGAGGVIDGSYLTSSDASALLINHSKVMKVLQNGY
jgi:type IV pilus assembly protein PilA